MRVQGILDGLRLDPNFESVLEFDVVRNRIVDQTRGKVPRQHTTAVQRPHRVFRRLSRTVIGRCPIGHLARKQKGVLHMCSSAIRSNHTKSAINGRTFPIETSGWPPWLDPTESPTLLFVQLVRTPRGIPGRSIRPGGRVVIRWQVGIQSRQNA